METTSRNDRSGPRSGLMPYALSFLAGAVVVAAVMGGIAWEYRTVAKDALISVLRPLGYDAFGVQGLSKAALLRAAPANYFRQVDMPKIVFDIKFEHWEKIVNKRAHALASGGLIQEAGDFVPASVRYSDGTTHGTAKIKLRLKGDQLDHLMGDKWSFRVRTRGKDHVYGMRRFSLQTPETRDFQLTPMMLELTKSLGLVSPRYFFADVVINGRHVGVMAVEEHPAKELLEASERKESVIIRFAEQYFWYALHERIPDSEDFKPFKDYRFAPIDSFQTSKIMKSATLKDNYRVAAGLLRGFTEGRLPASKVFDPELMGRFLAVIELFGAAHGAVWHNMRFYFNPQTLLLEPIPFDMSSAAEWGTIVVENEQIARAMLADPKLDRAFRASLKSLIQRIRSGELVKQLREAEARYLPALQKEYVLHGKFPLERIVERAAVLERTMFAAGGAAPVRHDHVLFARDYMDGSRRMLALLNDVTRPVTVMRVRLADCAGGAPGDIDAIDRSRLPLTVPAARPGRPPEPVRIELKPGLGQNCALEVDARLSDSDHVRTMPVDSDVIALAASPMPSSTVAAELAGRDFLSFDEGANELRVAAGDHSVRRDLVVPDGVALAVPAGTTLRFAPRAAIVAHGPVRFMGADGAPVTFRPADDRKGWQGIAVIRAGSPSTVKHARFIHTTGVSKPGWTLTGGVTFYESDVDIAFASFLNHNGEDALNVVRSHFAIANTDFDTTLSDAFDSDFSTGSVTDSTFTNVGTAGGGDAIDVSGTRIEVSRVTFHKVSDKAISVGEASDMTATDVTIDDAGTGLASKDRSRLTARNVTIRGARFAPLTAYIKKPEYGGATIVADNVKVLTGKSEALVQFGSRITLAGNDVAARDIDIDALYDTVMRKAGR